MNTFIFFGRGFVLVGAMMALVAVADVVDPNAPLLIANQTETGPNLPPEDSRSLFDIVAQVKEDGTSALDFKNTEEFRNKIFPMIKGRGLAAHENPEYLDVLMPFSRSLARAAVSYAYPRAVFTIAEFPIQTAATLGLFLKNRLYVAYSESTNSYEVISENNQGYRYEFQVGLWDDVAKKHKFYYADRAFCATCHIGQLPMFSKGPWTETNGHPPNVRWIKEIRKRVVADQTHVDFKEVTDAQVAFYQGFKVDPGVNFASQSANFELATQDANLRMAIQKLWREGCETSACRAYALYFGVRAALSANGVLSSEVRASAEYATTFKDELKKGWTKWPNGIQLPLFSLRDPSISAAQILDRRDIKLGDQAKTTSDQKALEALLRNFTFEPGLEPAEVPGLPIAGHEAPDAKIFKYPMVWTENLGSEFVVRRLKDFFTPGDLELLAKTVDTTTFANLHDAVMKLLEDDDAVLDAKPFSRDRVMPKLLAALGVDKNSIPLPVVIPENWKGQLAQEGSLVHNKDLGNDFRVRLFGSYCKTCHSFFPFNFAKAKTDSDILNILRGRAELVDAELGKSVPKDLPQLIHNRLDWLNYKPPTEMASKWHFMPFEGSKKWQDMKAQEEKIHESGDKKLSDREVMLKEVENLLNTQAEDDVEKITPVGTDPHPPTDVASK